MACDRIVVIVDDSVDIASIDPAIEFANMGSSNRVLCRTVTGKVGSE